MRLAKIAEEKKYSNENFVLITCYAILTITRLRPELVVREGKPKK